MYADWNYISGFPKKIVVVAITRVSRAKFFWKKPLKNTSVVAVRMTDSKGNIQKDGRTYLPVYIPVYLFTYMPVYLLVYSPVYLFTYMPVYLLVYSPVYLFTFIPVYLFTYIPVYLPIFFRANSSYC